MRLKITKRTFAVCCFLLLLAMLSNVYQKFVFPNYLSAAAGDNLSVSGAAQLLTQLGIFGAFALSIVLFILFRGSKERLPAAILVWLPFVSYVIFSIAWTADKGDAIPRLILFITQLGVAVLICTNEDLVDSLYKALMIFAVATCAVGVLFYFTESRWGFFSNGYGREFTGMFIHKGTASEVAALGGITTFIFFNSTRQRLRNSWIIAIPTITLVLTSTMSSLGGFLSAVLFLRIFRPALLVIGAFALLLPALYWAFTPIFEFISRDATLTGRTYLWALSVQQSLSRFIEGHGFVHLSETVAWEYLLQTQFRNDSFFIPHAHNLWIESMYKFGMIGTAILFWTIVIKPAKVHLDSESFSVRASSAIVIFYTLKASLTLPFLITGLPSFIYAISVTHLLVHYRS